MECPELSPNSGHTVYPIVGCPIMNVFDFKELHSGDGAPPPTEKAAEKWHNRTNQAQSAKKSERH